jgi:dihydrolipoamide dehydrogenase
MIKSNNMNSMKNEQQKFDVAVLGGGPGGYPAAIKAAQLGKSVALIEAKDLGGTCLNRGCIPSKALIAGAEVLHRIREAQEFGIVIGDVNFDYSKMVDRKDQVVKRVRKGLESLMPANKITLIKGFGEFTSPHTLRIKGKDHAKISADKIIIATGSEPRNMKAFPFDYKKIHDSTSLLEMRSLPKKIVIVGGGIIGCEFASLFGILDVKVAILEMMPRLLPLEAEGISSALAKIFTKRGIQIETNAVVEAIKVTEKGVKVHVSGGKTFEADIALVAVGREMNTSAIGLEKAGVNVQSNGLIAVNDQMETNVPGIYATGDIASTWWLAHVATHQGLVAASNACGHPAHMHYNAIPSVIFTHPEIATVGFSLEKAIENGYDATLGAFPFQALGKSQAAYQTEGMAQVVHDKKTGQILGAQVIGQEASTLIAEMALAITNELTIECIIDTIHAHPTLPEAWLEAALIGNEMPIHWPPKTKR